MEVARNGGRDDVKHVCPLCGAAFNTYASLYRHMRKVIRELEKRGIVREERWRLSRYSPRVYVVGARAVLGTLEAMKAVRVLHPHLKCEELIEVDPPPSDPQPKTLPPLLRGTRREVRLRVLTALAHVLSKHKGGTARVKLKHVILVLHGKDPYIRNHGFATHPYERALVAAVLRNVRELDGWRLVGVERRSGLVFVFRNVK